MNRAAEFPRSGSDSRPILRALRRRPPLRLGLVQLGYLFGGFLLGLALPTLDIGPRTSGTSVATLLFTLAGAVITLASVVFSLLFLVGQFGATTLTPRLTLFRDDPLVWNSFGMFLGFFVFATTAGLVVNQKDAVPVAIPVAAVILRVVALAVMRILQLHAFRSIQLAPTLADVTARGEAVLATLYGTEPAGSERSGGPGGAVVRWTGTGGMLCQIDLPKLAHLAREADVLVRMRVRVGDALIPGSVVMGVDGAAGFDSRAMLGCLDVRIDRSFDQDPMLAFRIVDDIALRALSPAVNDPATAAQAVDCVGTLLSRISHRPVDVGDVADTEGELRVVVLLPDWDDYVSAAFDEIADAARHQPFVARHLLQTIDSLIGSAPAHRQSALERRSAWVRAHCDLPPTFRS